MNTSVSGHFKWPDTWYPYKAESEDLFLKFNLIFFLSFGISIVNFFQNLF